MHQLCSKTQVLQTLIELTSMRRQDVRDSLLMLDLSEKFPPFPMISVWLPLSLQKQLMFTICKGNRQYSRMISILLKKLWTNSLLSIPMFMLNWQLIPKLRQDSYVPLQAAVKKYHDCMTQYYSDSNPLNQLSALILKNL